ncbi:MAG: Holliday junction branch migration protein RuvA [Bacteroidia bacterium]|nr:MAG: Holliday junction branch migration protein RuvA [Bacteroidia bacterium]
MFEYIKGDIKEITPTHLVLESGGIGYFIHISLNTYTALNKQTSCTLPVHLQVKEDSQTLFGFAEFAEREIFRLLISVSGIGANTARVMLSSLKPEEIKAAIMRQEVSILTNIKGIGMKTAQRAIIELKDKIAKTDITESAELSSGVSNGSEAVSALVMLGFVKAKAEKAVNGILKKEPDLNVEELIKKALKIL